jgi:lipoyl(octanoyl) transferase
MRTLKEWRFLPYEKLPCYENMAIDEYLIKYYEKTKRPVLRFYGWTPPSISIGKYQDAMNDINIEICTDDDMTIVRRMTGGGAILHDEELTYSIVCSEEDIDCKNLPVKETFEKLNTFIINMYKEMGLKAVYAKDFSKKMKFGEPVPFCFSCNEEYDILVRGKKLGGNAQSRKKDIIFQHGSIPFENGRDKAAKYFIRKINFDNYTTLREALKKKITVDEAIKKLEGAFKKTLKVKLREEKLNDREKEAVDKLVIEKYSSDEWNIKGENNNGHRG